MFVSIMCVIEVVKQVEHRAHDRIDEYHENRRITKESNAIFIFGVMKITCLLGLTIFYKDYHLVPAVGLFVIYCIEFVYILKILKKRSPDYQNYDFCDFLRAPRVVKDKYLHYFLVVLKVFGIISLLIFSLNYSRKKENYFLSPITSRILETIFI